MNEIGDLIAIEGLDGAGKTLAIAVVMQWLVRTFPHASISATREPGGTPLAEEIRRLFKEVCNEHTDIYTQALLMSAARMDHLSNNIIPKRKQGIIVVTDRYICSTFSYQKAYAKELVDNTIGYHSPRLASPTLTLYLDVEPEVSIERTRLRATLQDGDWLDTARIHELCARKSGYEYAFTHPEYTGDLYRINANLDFPEVEHQIENTLYNHYRKSRIT